MTSPRLIDTRLLRRLATLFVLAFACLLALPASFAERTSLAMAVPSAPDGAVDVGPVPAGQAIEVTLYLSPSVARSAALDAYLAALGNGSSASYHRWLTPAEFGERFGADAGQLAAVRSFVEGQGMQVVEVSASGLRVTLQGTATQMEAAFAPGLHAFRKVSGSSAASVGFANTAVPVVPAALAATIVSVGGFNTLAAASTTLVADGSQVAGDLLSGFASVVTANAARVVALTSSDCAETTAAANARAFGLLAKEAAAQGMTVLASTSCAGAGSVSSPGILAEVTSVALAPGLDQPVSASMLGARPAWQVAVGLPSDGLRQLPDLTVSSLAALAQTVRGILATMPAAADGSAPRLGSLNAALYSMASQHGLYTQPDGAADGTWEPLTGLGSVDLGKLGQFYPRGTLSDYVSLSATNYSPTHGQNTTLMSSVTDTSGKGNGAVPTGTVTFTNATGTVLGTAPLVNGTASFTINTLPGGSNAITATYGGDTTYATGTNTQTIYVNGEAATFTATTTTTPAVGGNIVVNATVTSPSGVGTPTGTITVTPQGTSSNPMSYTGTLTGSNGTATATVSVPATQAGNIVLLVACSTDASFTCYNQLNVNATVSKGTSTTTLTSAVNGGSTTLAATVTGAPSPATAPSGTVTFFNNGTQIGSATLSNGTATYTGTTPTGTTNFTATFVGDNNYTTSTSNGVNGGTTSGTTTTSLTVSPTTPINGTTTTFTATVASTGATGAATGTVQFYQDGVVIGQGTLNVYGIATFTSTTVDGTAAHAFYAKYLGDGTFAASQSNTVSTSASGTLTATSTTVTPTTVTQGVSGQLTATVTQASARTPTPTGIVSFYSTTMGYLGQGALNGGTATISYLFGTAGTQNVYAVYGGDTNYATSTSPSATVTVAPSNLTATTTTVAPANLTQNVASSLVATVTPAVAKTPSPTGIVSFFSSTTGLLGQATLVGTTATLPYTSTTVGTVNVNAVYTGDTNYSTSTSPAVPVTTSAGTASIGTTTVVTPGSTTPTQGTPTQFSATVSPNSGTGNPTGTVNFYSSLSGLIGSATLVGRTATLSAALTMTGAQNITATYVGDTTYTTSTSATVAVTVGASTTGTALQTITVSPVSPIPYGAPVTVTVNLVGLTLTSGTQPAGTETFAISPVGTLTGSAVTLVPTSSTSATGTFTFTAPTPGSYTITATCTATNFTCPTTAATLIITLVKGYTTTTLTALPATPVTGQPTTLTATIAPVAPSLNALNNFTGLVTFYSNGVSLGTGTVTGNMATFTTTLNATVSNVVTAVYSGDTNWNTSTSAPLTLVVPPIVTTGTLNVNLTRALYTTNLIFTASVTTSPTVAVPSPTVPYGNVLFYDVFNGQAVSLGTGNLIASGPYQAIAQFSTTGLLPGTHTITALFNATSVFSGVTTSSVVVNIDDYALSFNPPSQVVSPGNSIAATLTVTSINGFAGTVVLGCTPPSGSASTCSFNPAVLSPNGTSTLLITTTAGAHARVTKAAELGATGLGLTLAAALGWLVLPRRRRPALLGLVMLCGLFGASGCTNLNNTGGTTVTTGGTTGTPYGTLVYTITTSGSDGVTTNRHGLQYQVLVQ